MKYSQISFFKLNPMIAFCLTILSYSALAQTPEDQKTILDLEKQRTDAITLRDEKTLSDLIDETYNGVTASGKLIDKAEQLVLYKSTNPYVTLTAENVAVSVYESTAIVRGTLVSKTKSGTVIGQTRYLYVYLKKNDKWRIITSQETVVIKN